MLPASPTALEQKVVTVNQSVRWRWLPLAAMISLTAGCIETAGSSDAPGRGAAMLDPSMAVQRGAIAFVKGWQQGRRIAVERGEPCLFFFTTDWCTYCRRMETTTLADPAVVQIASRFVCILVDADEEPEICRRLQISGYPTLEMISPTGGSLGRLVGWQAAPTLVQALQTALQRYALLERPTLR